MSVTVDPRQLHPRLNSYRDGGTGGVGAERNVVGYVDVDFLARARGNRADFTERVAAYADDLENGRGYENPVIVLFDPRGRIIVGEGNHRVEAARRLGVTHLPARICRAHFDPDFHTEQGGRTVPVVVPSPSPFHALGYDRDYWPTDLHPVYLIPDVTLPDLNADA